VSRSEAVRTLPRTVILTMPRISLGLPSTISSGPVAGISEDSRDCGTAWTYRYWSA
jgi:hypothetical protein